MANSYGRMKIFATTAGVPLAHLVCNQLSCELGRVRLGRFKDGELDPEIEEHVRDEDVFIIAPTPVPSDNFFEATLLASAARGSSAGRVTYVVPYLGYARGDRKDRPRKPISAKIALRHLELARPDRFILLDVHAEQTLACIEYAMFDHLYGSAIGVPRLKELLGTNTEYVVAAPDHGAAQRAHKYARLLSGDESAEIVIFSKRRPRAGEIDQNSIQIIGNVKNRLVILVDDMIDSGSTIVLAAAKAKEEGAQGIWVFATHPVFSKGALRRIRESDVDLVFVTDSIFHEPSRIAEKSGGKVEILSSAGLIAQAIRRTHEGESLSALIL